MGMSVFKMRKRGGDKMKKPGMKKSSSSKSVKKSGKSY